MRSIFALAVLGALLVFPFDASADPSTGAWVKFGTSYSRDYIRVGETVVFAFPSGTANSALLRVESEQADACFDDDTGGSGGTGRATLKLALTRTGSDDAAISVPALNLTNTECIQIIRGYYWVNIDTGATGAENPIVVISGR